MKTKTEIICVVDKSGSMHSLASVTIEGFNKFINSQKELDPNASITTILFDNEYTVVHDNIPINNIELLNERTYIPRGGTALYDAIGKAISTVHSRIQENYEEPSNIICAILTDGEENASQEYSFEIIKGLIKKMTDQFNWEFAYLGANVDAFEIASSLNIPKGNTFQFEASVDGFENTYDELSRSVASYRVSTARGKYKRGSLFSEDN